MNDITSLGLCFRKRELGNRYKGCGSGDDVDISRQQC